MRFPACNTPGYRIRTRKAHKQVYRRKRFMANTMDSDQQKKYLQRLRASYQLTQGIISEAIEALNLTDGSRGLDAGCGSGHHTIQLAHAVGPGGRVIGLDSAPWMVEAARRLIRENKPKVLVEVVEGDLLDLPFDDGVFDWVFCKDTLWSGPIETGSIGENTLPSVKELARVVKPGGTIALLFWSSQMFLPGYPGLEARLMEAFTRKVPYFADTDPERHFLRAPGWLREAGLQEVKVRCFTDCFQAPLEPAARDAIHSCMEMLYIDTGLEPLVSAADWTLFRRLSDPASRDCLYTRRDYHCSITYSMFQGQVNFNRL
ncbi:MAG TPA: methyltransferase domain-containing protein [Bacteroidetes bacterium]|nr:methyltransferase domain-containing protein [Bacteroidota bacterium]